MRPRVATMIDSLSPENLGGAEVLAVKIARLLDRDRFESMIVTGRASTGPLREEVEADGVRVVTFDRSGRFDVGGWARLVRFLRRERIDVLHAHKFGSNVGGSVTARLAGVPVVLAHEHTWSYEGQPVRKLLDRFVVSRLADRFLAVSREDRRRMIEVEHVHPEKALYLPIGIEPLAPPGGRDVRAELGIPAGAPVVGTVCALRPQKALDVLVRAAAELAPEHPGLRVLIAGGGREEERLRALVAELGLGETVRLLGFTPPADVPDVLAAVDVAVNCSDFEGSPLGVMEFMAAGRAVVATRVGGTPDLIDDGVHGVLVEPQDPGGLAGAVDSLLRDPARRARLGAAGRERQAAEFDLAACVRRFEELYLELLDGAARNDAIRPT